MKRIYPLLLTVLICSSLFAQTDEATPFKHYVGVDAGASSGFGLSYRYQPKKWGIQANMFPSVSADDYNISIGATVIRSLYRTNKMQFFLYYGNHLHFEQVETYTYNYSNGYYTEDKQIDKSNQWVTGIGPGFEIYIAKRLSLNGRFGFAYFSKTDTEDWRINADGGIGLHFMF
jgi:hypothetical protein